LFIIQFTYHVPLDQIDALREAHHNHLDKAFASGMYLLAGPLSPRTGGVVLATGDRSEVEEFVAADPFITHHAATAVLTEFTPTRSAIGMG
jgi:uncharacterized protein YciI